MSDSHILTYQLGLQTKYHSAAPPPQTGGALYSSVLPKGRVRQLEL